MIAAYKWTHSQLSLLLLLLLLLLLPDTNTDSFIRNRKAKVNTI